MCCLLFLRIKVDVPWTKSAQQAAAYFWSRVIIVLPPWLVLVHPFPDTEINWEWGEGEPGKVITVLSGHLSYSFLPKEQELLVMNLTINSCLFCSFSTSTDVPEKHQFSVIQTILPSGNVSCLIRWLTVTPMLWSCGQWGVLLLNPYSYHMTGWHTNWLL